MTNKFVVSSLGHTWILDLDGTLVKHNGYKLDGHDSLLEGAKDFLEGIPLKDMIIIVTARSEEYRHVTELFLKSNGIRYDHIIFNAPYGERIVVNDCKPSGLAMTKAVDLERDASVFIDWSEDESI